MATEVDVCNLALSRCMVRRPISSLEENSEEAVQCRNLYPTVRDVVLQSFDWPFAAREAVLAEVPDAAREGWAHAYALPADCLQPWSLYPGGRALRPDQQVPFEVVEGTGQALLLTDVEAPVLRYTFRQEAAPRFSPAFVSALAWALARELALSLPGLEGLSDRAALHYEREVQRARALVKMGQRPDVAPLPEHLAARG